MGVFFDDILEGIGEMFAGSDTTDTPGPEGAWTVWSWAVGQYCAQTTAPVVCSMLIPGGGKPSGNYLAMVAANGTPGTTEFVGGELDVPADATPTTNPPTQQPEDIPDIGSQTTAAEAAATVLGGSEAVPDIGLQTTAAQ